MKFVKRLVSVTMAVAMALSLSVQSFAVLSSSSTVTDKNSTLKATATHKGDYFPGVEYRWNLKLNGNEIDRKLMNDYNEKVTTSTSSKYIESAKVRKHSDGTYDLFIMPVSKRYADPHDISVTVTFTNRDNKNKIYAASVKFSVEFDEKEVIYDDTVEMSEHSSRELTFDSDLEYCEIYFDDVASYDADVRRTSKANLKFNTNEITKLVDENPQAYLSFLSFPYQPTFKNSGTLYFYTKKDYLYSYTEGSGLKLLSKDNDSGIMAVQTYSLGTYVMSDEPLKTTTSNVDVSGMEKPKDTTGSSASVTASGGRINVSKDVIEKKTFAGSSYIINCNMKDYITEDDIDTMNGYLGQKGIAFRVVDGNGNTLSQMLIKPYGNRNVTKDIKIGANFDCATTLALFNSWFSNKVTGFRMEHYGAIGTPVEMAMKLDYTGMNTNNLVAYVYYPQSNTFEKLANTGLKIDSAGYTHLVTVVGGDIIISDGEFRDK